MLGTLHYSLQTQGWAGSGSGWVGTLVQQVVSFHSQPSETLQCDCLVLVMTSEWIAAGSGFHGSTIHLP